MPTDLEQLALDGLSFNGGALSIEGRLSIGMPTKRPNWLDSPDADGETLGEEARWTNRTIEARLRVNDQATPEDAQDRIAEVVAKLQECERKEGGLPLVWTPANSGRSLTFYALSAEVTELPIEPTGDDAGWLYGWPVFVVKLTCRPFGYGVAYSFGPVTSSNPTVELPLGDVRGDVDAEGVLTITAGGGVDRRHVEWGLHTGSAAEVATSLRLDSADMVTTGYAAGPGGPGTLTAPASTDWLTYCSTGPLPHVGTFRVRARVLASEGQEIRAAWRHGEGAFVRNAPASPPVTGTWSDVDLGLVSIPRASIGAQGWELRIEFRGDTIAAQLIFDTCWLIPAERYGKVRGQTSSDTPSGGLIASDTFDQHAAGSLIGKAPAYAPAGVWSEAGDTDDFLTNAGVAYRVVADDVAAAGAGNPLGGQFARMGSGVLAGTDLRVDVTPGRGGGAGVNGLGSSIAGAFLRFVDVNNWIAAVYYGRGSNGEFDLRLYKRKAGGTPTEIAPAVGLGAVADATRTLRVTASTSGVVNVYEGPKGGALVARMVTAADADLATGGALDDGGYGLYDRATHVATKPRYYDNLIVVAMTSTASLNVPAIYSGRSLVLTASEALRQNAAGTAHGETHLRGSRVLIPPAGDSGRRTRLAVKARRNDIEIADDANISDSLTIALQVTPRFLVVPQ